MGLINAVQYKTPNIPEIWNYEDSIAKVKPMIYKWKNLTFEILQELYIAREKLSQVGNPNFTIGANAPIGKTWNQYCQEIGIAKSTANRWLNSFCGDKKTKLIEEREDDNIKEDSPRLSNIKAIWNTCSKAERKKFIQWVKEYYQITIKGEATNEKRSTRQLYYA